MTYIALRNPGARLVQVSKTVDSYKIVSVFGTSNLGLFSRQPLDHMWHVGPATQRQPGEDSGTGQRHTFQDESRLTRRHISCGRGDLGNSRLDANLLPFQPGYHHL